MAHEFDGKKYETASSHQKEWGERLIADLDLAGSECVLDLGCGNGTLTARIAELVPRGEVVGIDASKGMIEAALPKSASNLKFQLLNIDDIDFRDQFDVVFSNAALHWVKDHRRLLANTQRSLRQDGRIRFNFAGDGNCSTLFAVVREAIELPEFAPLFTRFEWPWYMPPVDDYARLVDSIGLSHSRVWEENADRYFPDAETMTRWLDQPALVPFLAAIPTEKRAPFRSFVVGRMTEETRQADGTHFETFRRVNVSAGK